MNKNSVYSIPFSLLALTLGVFVTGTGELASFAMLPILSNEMETSLSESGYLVTLYALGVGLGGAPIVSLAQRTSKKNIMLAALLLFVSAHLLSAHASTFTALVMARVLAGSSQGTFLIVAIPFALALVPEGKKKAAFSLLLTGLTLAMLIGLPLCYYIGRLWGADTTMFFIAGLGALALVSNSILLPYSSSITTGVGRRKNPATIHYAKLALLFMVIVCSFTGASAVFSYLLPLLQKVSGFTESASNLVLVMFGIASAVGNVITAGAAIRRPQRTATGLFLLQFVILVLLWYFITSQTLILISVFVAGVLALMNIPAFQLLITRLSEKLFTSFDIFASGFSISAINLGIAIGTYIGGKIVQSQYSIKALPLVGAVFILIALILSFINPKIK